MTTRTKHLLVDDTGTSTTEYALTTVAAAVVAGALYLILSGQSVSDLLEALVQNALTPNT